MQFKNACKEPGEMISNNKPHNKMKKWKPGDSMSFTIIIPTSVNDRKCQLPLYKESNLFENWSFFELIPEFLIFFSKKEL